MIARVGSRSGRPKPSLKGPQSPNKRCLKHLYQSFIWLPLSFMLSYFWMFIILLSFLQMSFFTIYSYFCLCVTVNKLKLNYLFLLDKLAVFCKTFQCKYSLSFYKKSCVRFRGKLLSLLCGKILHYSSHKITVLRKRDT